MSPAKAKACWLLNTTLPFWIVKTPFVIVGVWFLVALNGAEFFIIILSSLVPSFKVTVSSYLAVVVLAVTLSPGKTCIPSITFCILSNGHW